MNRIPTARAATAQLLSTRVLVSAAFGVVVGTTASLTWPATALVLLAGALVLYQGRALLTIPPPRAAAAVDSAAIDDGDPGEDTLRAGALWAAWFVVFCLWELAAFLLGNDEAHPTFSMLTDPILAWYPTRAAAGFLWLLVGWRVIDR